VEGERTHAILPGERWLTVFQDMKMRIWLGVGIIVLLAIIIIPAGMCCLSHPLRSYDMVLTSSLVVTTRK
jgi:hypothetical protein